MLLDYVPNWNKIQKLRTLETVLLSFVNHIITTGLHQMHILFCCLCCWTMFLSEPDTTTSKTKIRITICAHIFTTELHQMHILFCCVCAAGLCSWLEQYTKIDKLEFVLLWVATIFATALHPTHTLFCCVCC